MTRGAFATLAILCLLSAHPFCVDPARADDVTATVSRGTLKLKGDADANTLTIDQAGLASDQLRVTGTGTTTVNGGAVPLVFDVTGGLQVDLGNGDDALTIDTVELTGTLKIKMGAGANTVAIANGTVHGAVSIDLGSGDNVLQFCTGTVDGALSIKVGAGTGATRSATCDATVSANGSALVINSVEVQKAVVLKGSKKSEKVTVQDSLLHAGLKLTVGGGSDAVAVCHSSIGGTLAVQMGAGTGGTITASCGDPGATGDNALRIDSCPVASNLSVKMGGAADTAVLTFGSVDGAIKVDLGQGANQLTLDGLTSHKNVTVKSGKGDDTIAIKNAGFGAGASIKAGAGTNAITFTGDDFPGNLTVVTGNGDDTIDTSGATVHGTTKIRHGKGTDVVTP